METEFILYVRDQARATHFYRQFLDQPPCLDVPGMTEFQLGPGVKLGLMPESGIARILCPTLPNPATGNGIPRCELYLKLPDIHAAWSRAIKAGATVVSPIAPRDWGHTVGYLGDLDGHVVAVVG